MDEQEMLKQFESDMTDLGKCAIYRRDGNTCTISCRLGNWSVSGPFGMELINEAMRYFEEYKKEGEYANLLSHIAAISRPRNESTGNDEDERSHKT